MYDYKKDKKLSNTFRETDEGEEVFDVDNVLRNEPRTGIKNNHPASAMGWKEKLEKEDEHVRNIK